MPKKTLYYSLLKKEITPTGYYQRNLLIDRSFFVSYGSMSWIILSLCGVLCIRDAGCRETKSLVVHVLEGYIIDWKTVHIFAYSSTCEQSNKKSGARLKRGGGGGCALHMLETLMHAKWFWVNIWLFWSFLGGPSFKPESEIVQSCNHADLTLLFLGVMLWATSWTVSLSQGVQRLMALFAASFVVISLIKRLDQSISPDFI